MTTDHSITKGYPYGTIISQERFKIRPNIILDRKDKNKTKLWMSKGEFPEYRPAGWLQRFIAGPLIDFLEFRIFDYAEALLVAENQIGHLLEERPFIPEYFGFIKTVGPKDIHDNPTKIYTSTWNENISLFRNDEEECEWHLLTRKEGFHDTQLQLPNHRIAYAAFYALGIKVEGHQEGEQERDAGEKLKDFTASYYGSAATQTIKVKAYDEQDAREKAQFIFETGDFDITETVDRDKLKIIK